MDTDEIVKVLAERLTQKYSLARCAGKVRNSYLVFEYAFDEAASDRSLWIRSATIERAMANNDVGLALLLVSPAFDHEVAKLKEWRLSSAQAAVAPQVDASDDQVAGEAPTTFPDDAITTLRLTAERDAALALVDSVRRILINCDHRGLVRSVLGIYWCAGCGALAYAHPFGLSELRPVDDTILRIMDLDWLPPMRDVRDPVEASEKMPGEQSPNSGIDTEEPPWQRQERRCKHDGRLMVSQVWFTTKDILGEPITLRNMQCGRCGLIGIQDLRDTIPRSPGNSPIQHGSDWAYRVQWSEQVRPTREEELRRQEKP